VRRVHEKDGILGLGELDEAKPRKAFLSDTTTGLRLLRSWLSQT